MNTVAVTKKVNFEAVKNIFNKIFSKLAEIFKKINWTTVALCFMLGVVMATSISAVNMLSAQLSEKNQQIEKLKTELAMANADKLVVKQNAEAREKFLKAQVTSLKDRWCLPF